MGDRIIYLFMVRAKDSWADLPESEREAIRKKVGESQQKVGVKTIVTASCEWSTPKYQMFGVQEFPSVAALQQHFDDQREAGALKHIEGDYIVGIATGDDD